jgi:hypothetical protein
MSTVPSLCHDGARPAGPGGLVLERRGLTRRFALLVLASLRLGRRLVG